MGRGEGASEQQLADLAAFEESPAFSEMEKRVLRYAVALTWTPADVAEEMFNGLREHFNPQQMVELTTAIAWENFRARFNRGFGVETQGFTEGAACPVHVGARPGRSSIPSPAVERPLRGRDQTGRLPADRSDAGLAPEGTGLPTQQGVLLFGL